MRVNSSNLASLDFSKFSVNKANSFVWEHSVYMWLSTIDKSLIPDIVRGDIALFIWILGENEGLEQETTYEIQIRHQIESECDCLNKKIVIKGIFRKEECQFITGGELEIIDSIDSNAYKKTSGKRFVEIEFDIDN